MPVDLLLLALLSAFWPTLIVVDVLAFQTGSPERILLAFLAGGLLTTVTIGTVLVVSFDNSQFGSSSQRSSTDVVLDLVVAGLAFLCALILARLPQRPKKKKKPKPPSAKRRVGSDLMASAIDHGAPIAFVGGILFNIVPGLWPLIALKDLMELHYSTARVVVTLLLFYLVMFVFLEVPIVAYLVAGDWTGKAVNRFNAWLSANHRRIVVWVLVAGGLYLTARGIYATIV